MPPTRVELINGQYCIDRNCALYTGKIGYASDNFYGRGRVTAVYLDPEGEGDSVFQVAEAYTNARQRCASGRGLCLRVTQASFADETIEALAQQQLERDKNKIHINRIGYAPVTHRRGHKYYRGR